MHLTTRTVGSQRLSRAIELTFEPNFTGQGGIPVMTFKGSDGKYYYLTFSSLEEGRELLSQAHIVYHNVVDDLHKEEAIASLLQRSPKKEDK